MTDSIQLIVFRVGEAEYGLPILAVRRVHRHRPPSPRPGQPPFLAGEVDLPEGQLPALDLRERCGLPAAVDDRTRLVLVTVGGQRLVLVVDEVRPVRRVVAETIRAASRIPPTPLVAAVAGEVADGANRILVLRPDLLLATEEIQALAAVGARG